MQKTFLIFLFLILFFGFDSVILQGQDDCSSAINMCDVVNLDGIGENTTVSLPNVDMGDGAPEHICNGDGQIDNPVWYVFIAGSSTIDISIFPYNCTTVIDNSGKKFSGLQAAIYDGCGAFNVLDCSTDSIVAPNSINLHSDAFICGESYYLALDGYSGSVCDYRIEVNAGTNLFELPALDSISFEMDVCSPYDLLCAGIEVPFTLWESNNGTCGDFSSTEDLYYLWEISSSSDYPTGIHPEHNSGQVDFKFSNPGTYTITCNVYTIGDTPSIPGTSLGYCDKASGIVSKTITIVDSQPIDEVFDDIILCEGKLPLHRDSVVLYTSGQDPNGDGIIGWLGGHIMSPGVAVYHDTIDCGCIYTQSINIIEIEKPDTTVIDTVICASGIGPFIVEGIEVSENLDTTFSTNSLYGCDSLINIKVLFIDITGDLEIIDCTDSVQIEFTNESIIPSAYDDLIFRWEDASGNEVIDLNPNDRILKVVDEGMYSLYITMEVGGENCEIYIGDIMVDYSLINTTPSPVNWPTSICTGISSVDFEVDGSSSGVTYNWTFPTGVLEISGQGTSKITLNWGNSAGGEVCVNSTNLCGTSDAFCQTISLEDLPDVAFDIIDTLCIDDEALLSYTGDTNHSYNYIWNFSGAVFDNIGTSDVGPYNLGWESAGEKTISLVLSNGVCSTERKEKKVYVLDKLAEPELICDSQDDKLIVSWDSNPMVSNYHVELISGLSGTVVGNSYEVIASHLGDSVRIAVYGETAGYCNQTYTDTITCYYEACPEVELLLAADQIEFCGEFNDLVALQVVVNGDNSGSGAWSGLGLVDDEHFQPNMMKEGDNYLYYYYNIGECNYVDSILIEVNQGATWEIEEIAPDCWDSTDGQLIIHNTTDVALYYSVNGSSFTEDTIYNLIGIYDLVVEDDFGCSYMHSGSILAPLKPYVSIVGNDLIKIGDDINLMLEMNIDMSRIDSIVWTKNKNSLCFDCVKLNMVQETYFEEYCARVYYDEGCEQEICKTVNARDKIGVYFPNIFSPESDIDFNTFIIDIGHRTATLKNLQIFDHWGGRMYSVKNLEISGRVDLWNGDFRGTLVLPGVYIYTYEIEFQDGKTKSDFGDVTVIR